MNIESLKGFTDVYFTYLKYRLDIGLVLLIKNTGMKDWETRLKKEENIRLDWTKTEIPRLGARSAPDLLNIDYNEKPSLTRPNLYPYYYPLPTPPAAPISITFFIDDWTGPTVDSNVSSYWPSHLDRMADHDSPEKFPSFASKISGSTPLMAYIPMVIPYPGDYPSRPILRRTKDYPFSWSIQSALLRLPPFGIRKGL